MPGKTKPVCCEQPRDSCELLVYQLQVRADKWEMGRKLFRELLWL